MTKNNKTALFAIPVLAALMLGTAIAPASAVEIFDCTVEGPTEINLELEPGQTSETIHKDITCTLEIFNVNILPDCTEGATLGISLSSIGFDADIDETFGVQPDFEGDSVHCEVEFLLEDEFGQPFSFTQEIWIDVIQPISPEEKIEGLIADVEALDLNHGNKNALNKKLANAIKNITNEDPTDDAEACEKLQSFIDQLNAFVNAGKLTQEQVDPLIDTATQCIWDLCLDT